jgi:hydroxymethylbilane synthase
VDVLRLATTSNPMALAQAARIGYRLETVLRPLAVVEVFVETPMDPVRQIARLGERLLDGSADAALCPASRLPAGLPHGVVVGALIRDRDPRYRIVAPLRPDLAALPHHARVVVCDPVARAQIRHRFPRLQVETAPPGWEIFAGLRHRAWDAACLPPEGFDVGSVSGLCTEAVPPEELLPAVGQGKVALLIRAEVGELHDRLSGITDRDMETALGGERAFLSGVAHVPGTVATARVIRAGWAAEVIGLLIQADGEWEWREQARTPLDSLMETARRMAAAGVERARHPRGAAKREVLVT